MGDKSGVGKEIAGKLELRGELRNVEKDGNSPEDWAWKEIRLLESIVSLRNNA